MRSNESLRSSSMSCSPEQQTVAQATSTSFAHGDLTFDVAD
ncbi:hypothetical protein [Candidatus Flexifilum breve]